MTIQLRARNAWKYCLSFFEKDWNLNDYPILVTEQDPDPAYSAPRFRQDRFKANILNWPMTGQGNSRESALRELNQHFGLAKQEREVKGEPLPRPGSLMPIEFARTERVHSHPELADDFIRRVLGFEWAWISDDSSLWDFHTEQTNAALHTKVKEIYGVDISDMESANLADILEMIVAVRARGGSDARGPS